MHWMMMWVRTMSLWVKLLRHLGPNTGGSRPSGHPEKPTKLWIPKGTLQGKRVSVKISKLNSSKIPFWYNTPTENCVSLLLFHLVKYAEFSSDSSDEEPLGTIARKKTKDTKVQTATNSKKPKLTGKSLKGANDGCINKKEIISKWSHLFVQQVKAITPWICQKALRPQTTARMMMRPWWTSLPSRGSRRGEAQGQQERRLFRKAVHLKRDEVCSCSCEEDVGNNSGILQTCYHMFFGRNDSREPQSL